jgi:hypothetical protein
VRQAQAIEHGHGWAQEQGRQGAEYHTKVFGWRVGVLEPQVGCETNSGGAISR